MNKSEVIIEACSLSRIVGDKAIVSDFTYAFERRKIYSIIGPSGAGKSSLLRLLCRLDEKTSGEVTFQEVPITETPPCELRRKIGYLFQTPYLLPGTVRDNLIYAESDLSEVDINRLLSQVEVEHNLLDRDTGTLSVGQGQRVALGRLLAMEPEVLLLDEPTSSLDPAYTEAIERMIVALVKDIGVTIIMVTHSPDQALRMGGPTLLLVDGKLVEQGSSEQVINSPSTEMGRKYKARQLQ